MCIMNMIMNMRCAGLYSIGETPLLQCRVPSLLGFKHVGVEVRLVEDGRIAVKRGTFGEPAFAAAAIVKTMQLLP